MSRNYDIKTILDARDVAIRQWRELVRAHETIAPDEAGVARLEAAKTVALRLAERARAAAEREDVDHTNERKSPGRRPQ